jgi:hypothetical protein
MFFHSLPPHPAVVRTLKDMAELVLEWKSFPALAPSSAALSFPLASLPSFAERLSQLQLKAGASDGEDGEGKKETAGAKKGATAMLVPGGKKLEGRKKSGLERRLEQELAGVRNAFRTMLTDMLARSEWRRGGW